MHKVIDKLNEQFEKTCRNIVEKGLSSGLLDEIYKLSVSIPNLERMEKGELETAVGVAKKIDENLDKYSNGIYDKNIDALYNAYIDAKRMYKQIGDQEHRDKVLRTVKDLIVEVHDMVHSMIMDSDFKEEKEETLKYVRMLADM